MDVPVVVVDDLFAFGGEELGPGALDTAHVVGQNIHERSLTCGCPQGAKGLATVCHVFRHERERSSYARSSEKNKSVQSDKKLHAA